MRKGTKKQIEFKPPKDTSGIWKETIIFVAANAGWYQFGEKKTYMNKGETIKLEKVGNFESIGTQGFFLSGKYHKKRIEKILRKGMKREGKDENT